MNYGIPDSKSEVSSIPCGGCGALLHCKDVALPGYLPSKLFSDKYLVMILNHLHVKDVSS